MQFMLLSHDNERALQDAGEANFQRCVQEAVALSHRMDAKGQYIIAAPLQPSDTAVNVRVRDGKTHVTDGPYAETHEVVGGFYLVDVPTIEDAIRFAEQHPGARYGTVEIRAVRKFDGLPTPKLSGGNTADE